MIQATTTKTQPQRMVRYTRESQKTRREIHQTPLGHHINMKNKKMRFEDINKKQKTQCGKLVTNQKIFLYTKNIKYDTRPQMRNVTTRSVDNQINF